MLTVALPLTASLELAGGAAFPPSLPSSSDCNQYSHHNIGFLNFMTSAIIFLSALGFASSAIIRVGNDSSPCQETILHSAVRSGDLDSLLATVKVSSSDLYSENCRGLTPMHLAIQFDNDEMVTALAEYKFDVRRRFVDGNTLLHFAVGYGSIDSVRKLISFGCPVDSVNLKGKTPLQVAVERNNSDLVNRLVRAGADKGGTTETGETYVELAVRRRASGALVALLDMGLKAEEHRPNHVSPVKLAVIANDVNSLNALLNHKAPMNLRSESRGRTLLHDAVYLGHHAAAVWLLDEGANPDARDNHGSTPLHVASRRGLHRLAKEILSWKVDINPRDDLGHTPLHYAKLRNHADLVTLLGDRGGKDL